MAEAINITAEARDRAGKGVARATRREGKVPAVIYGDKQDAVMISIDGKELTRLIHNPGFFTNVFAVDVAGNKHQVLARDLQLDPVTDRPLHVDFLRFNENTKIVLEIPVVFINEEESPGLKRGGVLNIVRREIELRCSPLNIPQAIEIDLTGLDIGDSVHISSLKLQEGAEPITDRDFTVVTVAAPTIMEEIEVETEGEEGEEGEEGIEGEEGVEGEEGEKAEGDSED
jgi:large subunit ribosomal protein L25